MPSNTNTPAVFWTHVGPPIGSGCREWGLARNFLGYGITRFEGRTWRAHRLAYTLAVGPITPGLHVLHHCDNPPCCNPAHLFVGTAADNTADKLAKLRQPRGETHGQAKLTAAEVARIRELFTQGGVTQAELAHTFGMSFQAIHKIVRGTKWTHLATATSA